MQGVGAGAARPSMYPQPGTSAAGGGMMLGSMSSANHARLVSKQAELEGLRALKDQSARMLKQLELLAEKVDLLADGGDTLASVMTSWQGVFRAIQIARSSAVFTTANAGTTPESLAGQDDSTSQEESDDDLYNYGPTRAGKPALIDTMVRIPVDLDPPASANTATERDVDSSS
ncbi:hypothetical protein BCV70DRAFT_198817 [Testicularia cyperi]|uniref:DASH complex subunit DAD2 n=1 Tax=Testicularia cyperi TaxID=1882483 RepID=A0A317XVI4_9BASI|nr:hypothetical protein BCV70DRAFT_198817 [Testicularia cyperi]